MSENVNGNNVPGVILSQVQRQEDVFVPCKLDEPLKGSKLLEELFRLYGGEYDESRFVITRETGEIIVPDDKLLVTNGMRFYVVDRKLKFSPSVFGLFQNPLAALMTPNRVAKEIENEAQFMKSSIGKDLLFAQINEAASEMLQDRERSETIDNGKTPANHGASEWGAQTKKAGTDTKKGNIGALTTSVQDGHPNSSDLTVNGNGTISGPSISGESENASVGVSLAAPNSSNANAAVNATVNVNTNPNPNPNPNPNVNANPNANANVNANLNPNANNAEGANEHDGLPGRIAFLIVMSIILANFKDEGGWDQVLELVLIVTVVHIIRFLYAKLKEICRDLWAEICEIFSCCRSWRQRAQMQQEQQQQPQAINQQEPQQGASDQQQRQAGQQQASQQQVLPQPLGRPRGAFDVMSRLVIGFFASLFPAWEPNRAAVA